MSKAQQAALESLRVIHLRKAHYDAVNADIKALQPEFPSLLTVMDATVEQSVVKALDAVLGDEIASYFLYEVQFMKGGGKITEADGVEWPIKCLEDVQAYVTRPRS